VLGSLEIGPHGVDGEPASQPGQRRGSQTGRLGGWRRFSQFVKFGGPVRGVLALHRRQFAQDLPAFTGGGVDQAARGRRCVARTSVGCETGSLRGSLGSPRWLLNCRRG
jgi:hypothetical protein